METVYKLTDKNGKTRPGKDNETQWGENVTHTQPGAKELCGPGWLHAYSSPLLAVLLNPAHANFHSDMLLWECEAEVGLRKADKIGCTLITTIKQIPLPIFTMVQKQAFAILVAKEVHKEAFFQSWADDWLSGEDRSVKAACAAANAAYAAGYAANAAACAAYTANAAYAASAAASAAANAAYAAASAAANAAYAAADLDLVKMAQDCLKY